jgi:alpha/beta superfamily hydrolase
MVHRHEPAGRHGRRAGVAVIIVCMNTTELPANPVSFPDVAASFMLDGPIGKLESISGIATPDGARRGVVVICHPLTVEGGSMHNKVVTMAERALRESGLDTVRFNFRGAGNSAGEFDKGTGESEDLAAVVAWVRKVRPDDALWLTGFSFGSYVTINNAQRLHADALISIAPPVGRREFELVTLPTCPWLVVQGEADEVVDPQAVFDWVDTLEHKPELIRMPDTSHFFHRRLMDLRGAIKHAVRGWLPPLRQA